MGEPLRHRQTKEAATVMFGLQPTRHISTLPCRQPTTGIADCCARAASGQAAAPPTSVMNSRRLVMASLDRRADARRFPNQPNCRQIARIRGSRPAQ